jgi:hypothetical protein
LEALAEAVQSGELPKAELVYRPLVLTPEERDAVERRFGGIPGLEIQIPQQACFGLDQYGGGSLKVEYEAYVGQLLDVDLVVMCLGSSLALDAGYLGIPTIAYLGDETGTLRSRHT